MNCILNFIFGIQRRRRKLAGEEGGQKSVLKKLGDVAAENLTYFWKNTISPLATTIIIMAALLFSAVQLGISPKPDPSVTYYFGKNPLMMNPVRSNKRDLESVLKGYYPSLRIIADAILDGYNRQHGLNEVVMYPDEAGVFNLIRQNPEQYCIWPPSLSSRDLPVSQGGIMNYTDLQLNHPPFNQISFYPDSNLVTDDLGQRSSRYRYKDHPELEKLYNDRQSYLRLVALLENNKAIQTRNNNSIFKCTPSDDGKPMGKWVEVGDEELALAASKHGSVYLDMNLLDRKNRQTLIPRFHYAAGDTIIYNLWGNSHLPPYMKEVWFKHVMAQNPILIQSNPSGNIRAGQVIILPDPEKYLDFLKNNHYCPYPIGADQKQWKNIFDLGKEIPVGNFVYRCSVRTKPGDWGEWIR